MDSGHAGALSQRPPRPPSARSFAGGGASPVHFIGPDDSPDSFARAFVRLGEGEVDVLREPTFCQRGVAEHTYRNLAAAELHAYAVEPRLRYAGSALFDSNSDPAGRDAYYAHACESTCRVLELSAPYESPLTVLQRRLLLGWRAGCRVQTIGGRPMSIGIGRVFQPSAGILAHTDDIWLDSKCAPEFDALRAVISAIVYLEVPARGGGLAVWSVAPDQVECEAMRVPDSLYAIGEDRLPAPSAVVEPTAGELVLIRASSVHAVRPILEGKRATISFFIGYRGPEEPLTFWS